MGTALILARPSGAENTRVRAPASPTGTTWPSPRRGCAAETAKSMGSFSLVPFTIRTLAVKETSDDAATEYLPAGTPASGISVTVLVLAVNTAPEGRVTGPFGPKTRTWTTASVAPGTVTWSAAVASSKPLC